MRDTSAIDYSEPIIDWLRNKKADAFRKWECIISGDLQQKQKAVLGESTTPCLPQFRCRDMQNTRFCDLRFRLGAGYLYCHQVDFFLHMLLCWDHEHASFIFLCRILTFVFSHLHLSFSLLKFSSSIRGCVISITYFAWADGWYCMYMLRVSCRHHHDIQLFVCLGQGDCKHTIIFRDMRLIHPDDLQNRAAYPIVSFQIKFRTQKCMVCKVYRAVKVTVDDKWAPDNPCYFCNDCYYLLHHSENGSLLYSGFSAYDYVHD